MSNRFLFPVAIGLIDGLITALIIASHAILNDLSISEFAAIRISWGSSLVGATSYLVAEYGRRRTDMVRVARHLNPGNLRPSKNRFVRLGILLDSVTGGAIALGMGFIGSMIPLMSYSVFNMNPYISLGITFLALGITGIYMGMEAEGSSVMWVTALILVGITMLFLGNYLRIFQ